MNRKTAAMYVLVVLLGLGVCLGTGPAQDKNRSLSGAEPGATHAERTVFLAGRLADEELITFTASVAGSGHPGVVLLDSPKTATPLHLFLNTFRSERVIPVGSFPEGVANLQKRLGTSTSAAVEWKRGPPPAWWKTLMPRTEQAVVCPADSRPLLLQAACLAGSLPAPLLLVHGEAGEDERLQQQLAELGVRKLFAAGAAVKLCRDLRDVHLIELADAEAVAAAYLRQQTLKGPIHTLVVANPSDLQTGMGGMSSLAPWIALQKRAALLLTSDAGDNTAVVVRAALQKPTLARAENLILVANLKAIPMERRSNPAVGKDLFIDMEPFTPAGAEPFSFATGRLFHEDRSIVPLMLARQRLLTSSPRRALVVSNPGGSLPLLETFSRHTVREMQNSGYETVGLFGHESNKQKVRQLLPHQDIFMWEGHYRTMVDEYELPRWEEPLRPALIFMQSCLALNEAESQPLLQRGALAVVGSATRNYSASGGAFSLAYFDGLLYDEQSLGGSLRQAKNFLLTYALLKEKRLGADAKLQGSNLRSAWAFTLWGDPTLKLPRPEKSSETLPAVRREIRGNTIVLSLPPQRYAKVDSGKYQSEMWPNSRLAGLVSRDENENTRRLVPFLFAEVSLPKAPANHLPQLKTSLPERSWIFCWDDRRKCGYLLVTPGSKEREEIRFQVRWEQ